METRLSLFCQRCIEAGWLAAAALIPLFFNVYSSRVFEPDKLTLLRTIVLLMALAWIVRILDTGMWRKWSLRDSKQTNPLGVPVLLLAGILILATVFSVTPMVSLWGSYQRLQGTVTALSYITLFFLVANGLHTREQVERLITVVVLTSVPISLYGLIQHFGRDPLPWGGDVVFRVTSTMGNAIFLGAYLIMAVPLTAVRFFHAVTSFFSRRSSTSVILASAYGVVLLLQLVVILFTKSRGPWIGLGVGSALLILLWSLRRGKTRLFVIAGVCLPLAAFLILLLNLPQTPFTPLKQASPYLERLGTILDMESGTNKVRRLIWFGDGAGRGAVGLIFAQPIRTLIGYGPESMYVAYNQFYPPDLAHYEARNATPDRSHNDILDFLVTSGVVGLFVYLLILVGFFMQGIRSLWAEGDLYKQGIIIGILSAVAAHVVESLSGIAIASTRTYVWLFMGVMVALPAISRHSVSLGNPSSPLKQLKGKLRRREHHLPVNPTYQGAISRGGRNPFPFFVFVSITFVGVPFFILRNVGLNIDPSVMAGGALGWLLVGLGTTAAWIKGPAIPAGQRSSLLWLYPLVVMATLFFLVYAFLNTVIADMYFKKGQAYATAGRYAEGVPYYVKAVQWDPLQDYYYLFLGQAFLEMTRRAPEGNPTQASGKIEDLYTLSSQNLGRLGKEGLFQAALVALQQAQKLNPLNTDHSANLARLYRVWGEGTADPALREAWWNKALDYYEKATALSPNAAHLYVEWGLIYFLKGNASQALEKYAYAEKLDNRYSVTYAYLGDLYRSTGEEDKALLAYNKAVELDGPELRREQLMAIYSNLGEIYYRKGKIQESIDENLKLTKIAPNDIVTHRNLAILYQQIGNIDKAREEANIALSLAPKDQQGSLQAFIAELGQGGR
ncbi:MAG: O-antigen ligase family protein [Chloroflexi bacterium]|nr:O-antigen ligase family protein [Chloroflexota bacterium]